MATAVADFARAPGLLLVLVSALALLNGCASLKAPTNTEFDGEAAAAASAHAAAINAFDDWRLAGRIGVQHDDQGFSADLEWRQQADLFDLRIIAPLNGGTFALRGNDHSVTLTTPKGESYSAASAEVLMAEHLGWTMPLRGARYWVRGMPAPGSQAQQERRDESGRWTDFAQDGWRVSILDYLEEQRPQLPRKLFLSRDTLKVRLIVKQWERR